MWNSIKYKYLAKVYYSLHSSKMFRPAVYACREICNKLNKKKVLLFYSKILKKRDLCFDIGANIGNRAEIFLELGCNVIAVEPQKESIDYMKKRFATRRGIIFVNKAADEKIQEKELFVCDVDVNSSMSNDWISALKKSGRCQSFQWSKTQKIITTTLDELIKQYGKPKFCKIDVEGYELNVLNGLSQSIPYISFEFTQECIENAKKCIELLSNLGEPVFNFAYGESMNLMSPQWLGSKEMINLLKKIKEKTSGDIYVQFKD